MLEQFVFRGRNSKSTSVFYSLDLIPSAFGVATPLSHRGNSYTKSSVRVGHFNGIELHSHG